MLQKQPSRHSCLATSFAMVLKIEVKKLMNIIGHDGSEIIDPTEPEPKNRRSFHIQELIDIVYRLNYTLTAIECIPSIQLSNGIHQIWNKEKCFIRINEYLKENEGVLINDHHAVAWINQLVHDPCGRVYSVDKFPFHTFYIINKKERISVFG